MATSYRRVLPQVPGRRCRGRCDERDLILLMEVSTKPHFTALNEANLDDAAGRAPVSERAAERRRQKLPRWKQSRGQVVSCFVRKWRKVTELRREPHATRASQLRTTAAFESGGKTG
jgi:hypothetical protein